MKHLWLTALICLLVLSGTIQTGTVLAGNDQTPTIPDISFTLPLPQDPKALDYLGLPAGSGEFSLGQVKADILIVEIFSMYCPICQREAVRVNTLYEKIRKIPGKTVRLLGIGAGNSAFEVDYFKENYQIPFPVFSDGDFIIHKKIGEQGTPFFIALTPKDSQIFFLHSGDMGDLDVFLDDLIKSAP